jgi:3-oxoacyl-[acyl-carrier-protein] synthase III
VVSEDELMHASIKAIEYYVPEQTVLSTEVLASMYPDWGVESIDAKTGVKTRHIVGENEYASDMAAAAAAKLFARGVCRRSDVDYLILCTQSPDYVLPATACVLQDRLGLRTSIGAVDINLGCSGYVYGLGLAEGLIASGQATTILFLTSDAISRYLRAEDKLTRTLVGDGAAATLITACGSSPPTMGPFIYGTDGRGSKDIIFPGGGAHRRLSKQNDRDIHHAPDHTQQYQFSAGRVLSFAVSTVPGSVSALLDRAELKPDDIDLFVFHQANGYILEELRRRIGIRKDKFVVAIADTANTSASTIPIALKFAEREGRLLRPCCIMLVAFGTGFSWGGTILRLI